MLDIKQWLTDVFRHWYAIKNQQLAWKQKHQEQLHALKQVDAIFDNNLAAQLKRRNAELEHELTLLKMSHGAQLDMHKTKLRQDVVDYKQYLEALEQLKIAIQKTYTHLPTAVAFTIHHHAKFLLNAMWEAKDESEKMQRELQLIRFMSSIQEDTRLHTEGATGQALLENTLKLIQQ